MAQTRSDGVKGQGERPDADDADGTPDDASPTLAARLGKMVQRVTQWRPVRVLQYYGAARGHILASGLAYQAIFAVFAAVWISFAVAGLVLARDIGLRQSLIAIISESVPGLIGDGPGGAIDPETLLTAGIFEWTGAIALVGLLVTALGWLASARDAVRVLFGLPPIAGNVLLVRAKDLGLAVGFGALLLLSALLSVMGTQATDLVLGLVGLRETPVAVVLSRILSLTVMFALDVVVLAALYRVLAGVAIPFARLRTGALIGAAGLGVLKVLGSLLLGGASSNPLLASFAVIIGLLIFFNLVCQVILIAAAWIAVGVNDAHIVLDLEVQKKRLEEARVLVAEYADDEPGRQGFWARLLRR